MIDGKPKEYEEYYQKLDTSNPYPDKESFWIGYMYDDKNPCSLMSGLTAANDNAIVLREEIMSETLSYIELSLSYIRKSAEKKDDNITDLQPITDYLLAFWGSIDERVFDERVRNFLRIGKLVENIDMHISPYCISERTPGYVFRAESALTGLSDSMKVFLSEIGQEKNNGLDYVLLLADWNTKAFSLYSGGNDTVEDKTVTDCVNTIFHFMKRTGLVDYADYSSPDYNSRLLDEEELIPVRTPVSGILYKIKHACDAVKKGEVMASVIDPYYGQVLMEIQAPSSGIVFFAHNKPLVLQNTIVYKIV